MYRKKYINKYTKLRHLRILSILKLENLSSTKDNYKKFTTKHMEVRNTMANIQAQQLHHCYFSICFYFRLHIGIYQKLWHILPENKKIQTYCRHHFVSCSCLIAITNLKVYNFRFNIRRKWKLLVHVLICKHSDICQTMYYNNVIVCFFLTDTYNLQ